MQRFKSGVAADSTADVQQQHLRLATAAILLDAAYADGTFSPPEDSDLAGFLKQSFRLDETEVHELVRAADEIRARTIDHFALTNYIRKNMPLESRIDIVKAMWRIVYADGKLTDYENYLVRKLADLLGLEHHVMISAKVAVLEELGKAAK